MLLFVHVYVQTYNLCMSCLELFLRSTCHKSASETFGLINFQTNERFKYQTLVEVGINALFKI